MLAKSRLRNLKSRLDKNTELLKNYSNIINDCLNEGITESVNDNDTSDATHYLPHQPVVREERYIKKVRIVYNASAKTSGQFSLNDSLHSGPCLLPVTLDILLRFRLGQVVFVTDMRQAFSQLEIDSLHRDYLRFMCYESMDGLNLINIYRFTRLGF